MNSSDSKKKEAISRVITYFKDSYDVHSRSLGIILNLIHIAKDTRDLIQGAQKIVDCLSLELGFENTSILRYDSSDDCLKLLAAKGLLDHFDVGSSLEYNKDLKFKRDEGIAWKVFDSKEPIFIEDTNDTHVPLLDGVNAVNIRSLACLPIGEIGVLNLSNSVPRNFNIRERQDLIIITQVIANFLESIDLKGKPILSHLHVQKLIEAKTKEISKSKKELQDALKILDGIIRGVPQGLALLNPDGRIYSVNEALIILTNSTAKGLVDQPFECLLHRQSDIQAIRAALEDGRMTEINAGILRAFDGELIPVDIFYHPCNLEDHGIVGMIIFHDLRGQKKRLEEMVQIEKMKALGLMAQGVAHDFNNILAMIMGNVEILMEEIDNPDHLKRLERIKTAVSDGSHIVKRLNAYVGKKCPQPDTKVDDLREVVDQVIEFVSPRIKECVERIGIPIEIRKKIEDVGKILISPEDLKEILANLIFNAIDAMPEGGVITISAKRESGRAIIEVEDTGLGIPEEQRDKIFDPFYTTKGVKSSGLGLFVTQGLLKQAGGRVWFESRVGKGTKFVIELPIFQSKNCDDKDKSSDSNSEVNLPRLRVLVVDDEFIIVELLTMLLEKMGHMAKGITDPGRVKRVIEQEDFDLVLTDLGMPGMSGFDVATMVKKKDPKVKVVLITGWGAEYEEKDLKDKGIDGLLSKPFKSKDLQDTIKRLF